MGQAVVFFEVFGKDVEKLRSYYTDLFDWKIDSDNPANYGMVAPEEGTRQGIPGGIAQSPDGYGGHLTFYVEVDDVETALAKAEELGGKRVMGPMEPMPGTIVGQFLDPEGHAVGVVQH